MEDLATLELQTSSQYIGRWNHLVSTTNWEKGRIIFEWREALQAAGASALAYTDEAWSQRVGNVTPQHVGRLRRVFERFGEVHQQYAGLYWSHFHAAIDWPDGEMYLEGAVQGQWSVSQMREKRAEAMGGLDASRSDFVDAAIEGDVDDAVYDDTPIASSITETFGEVHDAETPLDGATFDAERHEADERAALRSTVPEAADEIAAPRRPFESLPPLPADINDAFELMKLAILNHKVSSWRDIAREDVLAVLESLRQLALAPAG